MPGVSLRMDHAAAHHVIVMFRQRAKDTGSAKLAASSYIKKAVAPASQPPTLRPLTDHCDTQRAQPARSYMYSCKGKVRRGQVGWAHV